VRTSRSTGGGSGRSGTRTATTFDYREEGDLVRARYSGGSIRLGFPVGLRDDDAPSARYARATTGGGTTTGHTESRVEVLGGRRLRPPEDWTWDSREGSGTSVVEGVADRETDDTAAGTAAGGTAHRCIQVRRRAIRGHESG
jgi:hypothetical protein